MRGFIIYVIEASKFNKTGNGWFTKIIFLMILLSSTISLFVPLSLEKAEIEPIAINLLLLAVANISGVLYLKVFLSQIIRTESPGTDTDNKANPEADVNKHSKTLILSVFSRIHIIITAMIFFYLVTLVGIVFLFVIPGIFFFTASIFYMCRILDKKEGIIASLKGSWRMTYGYRSRIFMFYAGYTMLMYIATSIVLSLFEWLYETIAGAPAGLNFGYFIIFFMLSISSLMQQRFIGQIYADIEYNSKKAKLKNKPEN